MGDERQVWRETRSLISGYENTALDLELDLKHEESVLAQVSADLQKTKEDITKLQQQKGRFQAESTVQLSKLLEMQNTLVDTNSDSLRLQHQLSQLQRSNVSTSTKLDSRRKGFQSHLEEQAATLKEYEDYMESPI